MSNIAIPIDTVIKLHCTNLLDVGYLKDLEGGGRITLKYIFWKYVAKFGVVWNTVQGRNVLLAIFDSWILLPQSYHQHIGLTFNCALRHSRVFVLNV
jgi:hypothetical protein